MNPKQLEKYFKAYQFKKEEEIKQQDYLNHLLGRYIAYAFNDPKKYPKKPYLCKGANKKMSDADMEMEARKLSR